MHRLVLALLATAPALFAQVAASYTEFGSGCPGTGTGMGADHVAPQQFAASFMPSNNAFGFSGSPQKYQQVFVGSEFPTAFVMNGLALRQDNQTAQTIYGALVDLEIQVGYTTKTPTTLSTTFAANFDSGAPVTVLPRSFVSYPDLVPPVTNPTQFQLVIPWTNTFAWVPQPGRNLLIQVIQRGSSSGPGFVYVLDCGWSASTARLYGADTATTGSLDGYAYGYVMDFKELTNTAVPILTGGDAPQFGSQLPINVKQAKPSTIAVLITGLSNTTWSGLTLPLDLGFVGAAGCTLLTSWDIDSVVVTNAAGRGQGFLDIPLDFSMAGVHFYNQFLLFDPTANALGFVCSNGGLGIIGN